MKQIILAVATGTALAASPAFSQTSPAPESEIDQGRDLIDEGARLLLRGLMSEVDPTLQELRDFADGLGPTMQMLRDEMGPALADMMAQIDDIRNYDPPVVLPNGDIVIRRKDDAPVYLPPPPEAEPLNPGQTDL